MQVKTKIFITLLLILFSQVQLFAAIRNVPLTTASAREYLQEQRIDDDISGIYHLIKKNFHGSYLVLPSFGDDAETWDYTATALESSNPYEAPGSVKFFMRKKDGRFVGFYYDAGLMGKAQLRGQFLASPDSITVYLSTSTRPSFFIKEN